MLPKPLARVLLALAVAMGQDVFASGSVFVADTSNDEVREYDSELGREMRTFAPIDTPVDLAYGPDGRLYVASQAPEEADNAAILRIDPQGDTDSASLFTTFGIEGIAALSFGPGGKLYAGSSRIGSNARVVRYDLAAPFGGEIVVPGPVESSLGGLAVLPNGEVLVSENDGIRRYSGETGEFLGIFSQLVTRRLAIGSNGNVLATFAATFSSGLVELDRTTGAIVITFSGAAVASFTPDDAGNVFAVSGPHQDLDFIDRLRPPFGRSLTSRLGPIGGVALVPHPVFVVDTLIDTIDVAPNDGRCQDANGNCSLRAAVMEANALPGRETVVLPAGPLVLSRGPGDDQQNEDDEALVGDLDVLGDIDLVGRGGTFIDGAQLGSLLHVLDGRCFVRALTLHNGHSEDGDGIGLLNAGGHVDLEFVDIVDNKSEDGSYAGILNEGILHAKHCDLSRNTLGDGGGGGIGNFGEMLLVDTRVSHNSSNHPGGIYNGGSLTIRNCTLEGNHTLYNGGGAIFNSGELHISRSILRQNTGGTSSQGGAIYNLTTATIEDSAIVDNQAENGGGGIFNAGTLQMSNVTVSGNKVDSSTGPGGGIANEGTLELASCTVANNFTTEGAGGGISANGSITSLRNTIVAGNSAFAGGPDCAGTINSQGYNLFSDDESCSIEGDTTGVKIGGEIGLGDLVEAPQPQVPPIRFFLRTLVHPLLPGSLAEGTGSPADPGSGGGACPAFDQRGVERPQPSDGRCDMGAYESTCGNGVVETKLGELCDDGDRLSGDCCSGTCQFDPTGTPCGGDSGACADDVCENDLSCVHIPNTQPCDDANACTTDDHCGGGVCQPGLATNCDDGVACTADSCNATIGCIHIAVDALCVDGNDCTVNVCDSQLGCVASPLSGSCPDDDACTTNETCSQGACVSQPVNCSDGDLCTNDSCDSALGCRHVLGVSCAAPDACHDAGACEPETGTCVYPPTNPDLCEVAGQCELTSACDPMTGECTVTAKPNGSSCDDGNRCTVADSCEGGSCASGSPRTCAPIDECHRAGVCDVDTGVCSDPVQADGTSCDADRNACTRDDTCHNGVCEAGAGVSCAARDACRTAGACDPSTGLCSEPLRDCNDGDACTTDRCDATAGCLSISVEGIGAVRCIFEEPGILVAECASADLPPRLFKLFKRAESRIGGVETKPSVRATGRLLRKMVKAIDRGRSKGRISDGCAEALAARLKGASQRAALWLKNT